MGLFVAWPPAVLLSKEENKEKAEKKLSFGELEPFFLSGGMARGVLGRSLVLVFAANNQQQKSVTFASPSGPCLL